MAPNKDAKTTAEEPSSSPLSSPPEGAVSSPVKSDRKLGKKRDEALASPTPATKKGAVPRRPKKAKVTKPVKKRKWTAANLITDHKSPLATADLRAILANPMSWEALSVDEKKEVIACFPDGEHILDRGGEDARLNLGTLMNDDNFRKDCTNYTENIAQGRHDPEWLACAWAAHERRKAGDFDQYLVDEFETDWEIQLPDDAKPTRKDAQNETALSNESEQDDHEESLQDEETVVDPDEASKYENEVGAEQDEETLADAQEDPVNQSSEACEDSIVVKTDHTADELQGEPALRQRRRTTSTLRRASGRRKQIDAEGSEDELA